MYWPMTDSEADASACDYYARLGDDYIPYAFWSRQTKLHERRIRMARKKRRGWA